MTTLDRAIAEHRQAASDFADRVSRVPAQDWPVPRAPGKWSPAEEALHVQQVYHVLIDALAGGAGLRPRVTGLRAWVIRHFAYPLFLRFGRLPRNVRAPREVKPEPEVAIRATPAQRAAQIRIKADEMETALTTAVGEGRTVALRHPYFGLLDDVESRRFIALHAKHHMRNFPD